MIKTNKEAMIARINLWSRISIEGSKDNSSSSSHLETIWRQTTSTIRILTLAATPPCTSPTAKWRIHSTPNTTIQASSKCKSNSRSSRELSHLLRVKIVCTDSSSSPTMRAEGSHSMMNNRYTTQTRTCRMKESQVFLMEMIARIRYSQDNSIFNDLLIILSP